jgi:hypothetical protein
VCRPAALTLYFLFLQILKTPSIKIMLEQNLFNLTEKQLSTAGISGLQWRISTDISAESAYIP